MFSEFKSHIAKFYPELQKEKFILACSAGVDSVVLAHLCARNGFDFVLAHCNFQLRNTESDEDELFVQNLANELNILYFVKTFDTRRYANQYKLSIQVAARELRYDWFEKLTKEHEISYVLTAHHADDALETFLINLSRGTGIRGLAGIPDRSGHIFRPFLVFSRSQILEYAQIQGIKWREDSSNEELYYLRNKIRHELVPKLKELHPTFLDNFKQTQVHLEGSLTILDRHVMAIKSDLFKKDKDHWKIEVEPLKKLEPRAAYLHALFSEYGFTEWDNVADLLDAISGKQLASRSHRLIKDRDVLLLVPNENHVEAGYKFKLKIGEIKGPVPMLVDQVDSIGECASGILYVDKETLKQRLEVRKWKKGDYFYPLGMKGRKLVSKYFKDNKMNTLEKETQWLLFSGEQLVWVIGRRADDRFKITPQTKNILRFRLIE